MLIKDNYKLNRKGEISIRERVRIKCNKCGNEWKCQYKNFKLHNGEDFCLSCAIKKARPKRIKISTCLGCKKDFEHDAHITRKYCCIGCRDFYIENKKFAHLEDIFENNINELSYLCGLILGDGYIKKVSKNTSRISIAFDIKYPKLLKQFKKICSKLRIKLKIEPQIHSNCQMVGFSLHDNLLKRYGMLWSGDKYKANPYPVKKIVKNINFSAGLINSDGYYSNKNITFSNTVYSIVEAYCECLSSNKIKYSLYKYKALVDKRNGNINRKRYQVYTSDLQKLYKSPYYIKGKCSAN